MSWATAVLSEWHPKGMCIADMDIAVPRTPTPQPWEWQSLLQVKPGGWWSLSHVSAKDWPVCTKASNCHFLALDVTTRDSLPRNTYHQDQWRPSLYIINTVSFQVAAVARLPQSTHGPSHASISECVYVLFQSLVTASQGSRDPSQVGSRKCKLKLLWEPITPLSRKQRLRNAGEDSGKEEPYLLLGDCNWFCYYGNQWEVSQKLRIIPCLKT